VAEEHVPQRAPHLETHCSAHASSSRTLHHLTFSFQRL
jgi:hypothetical protein